MNEKARILDFNFHITDDMIKEAVPGLGRFANSTYKIYERPDGKIAIQGYFEETFENVDGAKDYLRGKKLIA